MELVIEHGGRNFDLRSHSGREEFDMYVQSLPTLEEQYAVNGMALSAIDKMLRARGFYCGLPLQDPEHASRELYGYMVPTFVDTINPAPTEAHEEKPRLINQWSFKTKEGKRGTVTIYENKDGKRFHRVGYRQQDWQFRFERHIISSAVTRMKTNPFQAELKAQEKLRTLLTENQYSSYVLSGTFIEIGKSGVWYALRRGLPTIAFRYRKDDHEADVLTALCMKPMGGHVHSFAGVMVPTDEVITTVLLIQADEPELWKRANHLPIEDPVSGL